MLNLALFLAFLAFVAVMLTVMIREERERVKAEVRWPKNWHELIK